MLVHVSVKDIALIDHVALALEPGMTVLTGETGAGKSILVEALLLLLGARASADVVRAGANEGSVEAQFALRDQDAREVERILEADGLPPLDDGALVLRRVVSREGRHKQFVNGALVTVAQLRSVAEPLVDFTGQHAHQALLRAGAQAQLLDAFGGHEALLAQMQALFGRARDLARELQELRQRAAEKERHLDVIAFHLEEIDAASPEHGEDERLVAEHKRLKNAVGLRASVAEAREALAEGTPDALTLLQQGLTALQRAARDDDGLGPLCRNLEEAEALVDDVARALRRAGEAEVDPDRLAAVEDRLDVLKRLMRKHGGDLEAVLRRRVELRQEREALVGANERLETLEAELGAVLASATSVADELSAKRKAAARKLAAAVESELPALGMPHARLGVNVEPLAAASDTLVRRTDKRALSGAGSDRVEIVFSANAGEPGAPLAKVASGGELSRVLLAVKRVLLLSDPVPVSIFDEVDAGVGGAVGEAIGDKLKAIGAGRQVIVISHLAQIAAQADHHLVVQKTVVDGRTRSGVRALTADERIDEVARMLGGREVTPTTLRHAEEMIARGRRPAGSAEDEGLPPAADKATEKRKKKSA